jgi:hypothetical protein
VNKPLPRSYWRAERIEQMRRARNGQFYLKAHDLSEFARGKFIEATRANIAAAREANRALIRSPKV